MPASTSTQILSFDNFGALENHLRVLKNRYNDLIRKYEETLGYLLRDTRPAGPKGQKVQQKWSQDMQLALTNSKASSNTNIVVAKKEEHHTNIMNKLPFGSIKGKEKQDASSSEWISLDPMSIFVGSKNKGLAEIYFDTINSLRDTISKINLALSICSTLKAKAATTGNTSLVVSFVNDVPTKVLLKPTDKNAAKKYSMAFSFAIPAMPPAAKSVVLQQK
jgi:hypothetical protein